MRINFVVNEVFDGWEPFDTRLGGTERGVVEWSEELVKRGHEVYVYRNGRVGEGSMELNGVHYCPRDFIYSGGGSDRKNMVTISIKSSDYHKKRLNWLNLPYIKEPVIYYTNETDVAKHDLSPFDAVIHISQWAKDNLPVNNENVFVVPHGYDPTNIFYKPGRKVYRQALYASSPDRGLDDLLEAWPKVVAAHPDATLLITYGGTGPDLPGVTYLGEVDEDLMAHLFQTSDILAYPCNGGELFCITGIKAQASGTVPVVIPTMALSETIKHGYFTTKEDFAEVLAQVMDDENRTDFLKRREAMVKDSYPTIAHSTDVLLNVINTVINKQEKKTKQNEQLRSQ